MENNMKRYEVLYEDIGPILSTGIVFTEFSPFTSPAILQKINSISASPSTYKENFQQVASLISVVANPLFKIHLRFGGGRAPLSEQTICYNSDISPFPIGILFEVDKVNFYEYDSMETVVSALVAKYASHNEETVINLIPPFCTFEEFTYVLHSIDTYRRMFYNSLLTYSPKEEVVVPVQAFIEEMKSSIIAKDLRWLMPSSALLIPNIELSRMRYTNEGVKILIDSGICTFVQHKDSNAYGLSYTSLGMSLGVEFERSWNASIGFEMTRLSELGVELISRGILIPTASTNHFVTINEEEGDLTVNHQAFHYNQLHAMLTELLDYSQA